MHMYIYSYMHACIQYYNHICSKQIHTYTHEVTKFSVLLMAIKEMC